VTVSVADHTALIEMYLPCDRGVVSSARPTAVVRGLF
jgi:hypothetical protein